MEGDGEENRLWVVEPAEIQTDLLSEKVFAKSTGQRIVPVRTINLSGREKCICKNSDGGQYGPVEAVINN